MNTIIQMNNWLKEIKENEFEVERLNKLDDLDILVFLNTFTKKQIEYLLLIKDNKYEYKRELENRLKYLSKLDKTYIFKYYLIENRYVYINDTKELNEKYLGFNLYLKAINKTIETLEDYKIFIDIENNIYFFNKKTRRLLTIDEIKFKFTNSKRLKDFLSLVVKNENYFNIDKMLLSDMLEVLEILEDKQFKEFEVLNCFR